MRSLRVCSRNVHVQPLRLPYRRAFGSSPRGQGHPYLIVGEPTTGIKVVTMSSNKVNCINDAFLDDWNLTMDALDDDCSPIIWTGEEGTPFSAGLDLVSMKKKSPEEMKIFLDRFNLTLRRFFELPHPVIAAVSGHAIAGGALIALACDYRIAAGNLKFGVNEIALGVPFPSSANTVLRHTMTARPAFGDRFIFSGELVAGNACRDVGFVDEYVDGGKDPHAAAVEQAIKYAAIYCPPERRRAYVGIKRNLRAPALAVEDVRGKEEDDAFLSAWCSESTQTILGSILAKK